MCQDTYSILVYVKSVYIHLWSKYFISNVQCELSYSNYVNHQSWGWLWMKMNMAMLTVQKVKHTSNYFIKLFCTDTLKHTYTPRGSEAHKRTNGWIEERSATPIWT